MAYSFTAEAEQDCDSVGRPVRFLLTTQTCRSWGCAFHIRRSLTMNDLAVTLSLKEALEQHSQKMRPANKSHHLRGPATN